MGIYGAGEGKFDQQKRSGMSFVCTFCQRIYKYHVLMKHVLQGHRNQPEVRNILRLPVHSLQRMEAISELRSTMQDIQTDQRASESSVRFMYPRKKKKAACPDCKKMITVRYMPYHLQYYCEKRCEEPNSSSQDEELTLSENGEQCHMLKNENLGDFSKIENPNLQPVIRDRNVARTISNVKGIDKVKKHELSEILATVVTNIVWDSEFFNFKCDELFVLFVQILKKKKLKTVVLKDKLRCLIYLLEKCRKSDKTIVSVSSLLTPQAFKVMIPILESTYQEDSVPSHWARCSRLSLKSLSNRALELALKREDNITFSNIEMWRNLYYEKFIKRKMSCIDSLEPTEELNNDPGTQVTESEDRMDCSNSDEIKLLKDIKIVLNKCPSMENFNVKNKVQVTGRAKSQEVNVEKEDTDSVTAVSANSGAHQRKDVRSECKLPDCVEDEDGGTSEENLSDLPDDGLSQLKDVNVLMIKKEPISSSDLALSFISLKPNDRLNNLEPDLTRSSLNGIQVVQGNTQLPLSRIQTEILSIEPATAPANEDNTFPILDSVVQDVTDVKPLILNETQPSSSKVPTWTNFESDENSRNSLLVLLGRDMVKIMTYIDETIQRCCQEMVGNFSSSLWEELGQCLLVKLALYNRLGIDKLEALFISDYNNRTAIVEKTVGWSLLSPSGQLTSHLFKHIRYNDNLSTLRISYEVEGPLNLFLETRQSAAVSPLNPFLFGLQSNSHMSAVTSIRSVLQKSQCQHPLLITGAAFRSHVSLMAMTLLFGENEMERVRCFMEHCVSEAGVEPFYRLPNSVYDLVRISYLLYMIDDPKLLPRFCSTHFKHFISLMATEMAAEAWCLLEFIVD